MNLSHRDKGPYPENKESIKERKCFLQIATLSLIRNDKIRRIMLTSEIEAPQLETKLQIETKKINFRKAFIFSDLRRKL